VEAAARVIHAVVLAAGRGERMGGPKALLVTPSGPLVSMHVARFREAGVRRVVVVTRAACVAPLLDLEDAADVVVLGADTGAPAESLAWALGAATADWIFVTPVDALPAAATTLRALSDGVTDRVDALTPRVGGRGGHPVLVRRAVLSGEPRPLRERLAALGPRRRFVDVDDPRVRTNLDTPEDVIRETGAPPRFLG